MEGAELSSPLKKYIGDSVIRPALPSLSEFARLINRPPDSDVTRALHVSIVGHVLAVRRLPAHAVPPHSASYDLPVAQVARPRRTRRRLVEECAFSDVIDRVLHLAQDEPSFLHHFKEARNFQAEIPIAGDAS